MSSPGLFRRLLIPVAFLSTRSDKRPGNQAFQLWPGLWITTPPSTISAIRMAAELTRRPLVLVHATVPENDVYHDPYAGWVGTDATAEVGQRLRNDARSILSAMADELLPNRETVTHVAPGHPVEVVLEAVERYRIDAIVVPAGPDLWLRRVAGGGILARLIRPSPCPVIVVTSTASVPAPLPMLVDSPRVRA